MSPRIEQPTPSSTAPTPRAARLSRSPATELYLELMKRALTNWLYRDMEDTTLGRDAREEGRPWRRDALAEWRRPCHTMASFKRLDSVQFCVEDVLARAVPGDLIETGVWRGGVAILMQAILAVHEVRDRSVWVADSFQGLPAPDLARYPEDRGLDLSAVPELAVSIDQVRSHFDRYGLLDGQVRFLKGWFRDTLPHAPIDSLALLRLDGDLYESTMEALTSLYPRLSVGGWLIVDDYGAIAQCRRAVHDYRGANGITDPIVAIDWTEVRWQRSGNDRVTRPASRPARGVSSG